MEKKCKNCDIYSAFYTKAYCAFLRSGYGYCGKEKDVKTDNEICECWRSRRSVKRKCNKAMVLNALEKGLTDIAALKQIFCEDDDSARS